MTINREPKQFAGKINEKFARTFPPERCEALARQSHFVQRTSSTRTGQDFFALMTMDMLDAPAVSLGGLCDILWQHHPQAVMTPQALHQRLNAPQAVAYRQEVFPLALREQRDSLYRLFPPNPMGEKPVQELN
jgi:hypothetical protein